MRYIFTIALLLTTSAHGSADTTFDCVVQSNGLSLSKEDEALLSKLRLQTSDPYSAHHASKTITVLTESEQDRLRWLANARCIDAQHYIWLGYFKGLYGFPKNTELAAMLKKVYKAASVNRKRSREEDQTQKN